MYKESLELREKEGIETRVVLEFMRHGQKENDKTKANKELGLSEEGRIQADAKGEKLRPQTEMAVGWGSPKGRTQETVYRAMLAEKGLSPEASLEEIEKIVSQELKVGKKMTVDERLDFNVKGPVGQEVLDAFKAGRGLAYTIFESDRRAVETGDKESSTYTRFAANIAELIVRYLKVSENFNRMASQTDKYEKFGNQLERYLGTHQTIVESFLAKILEKIYGSEKKEEFVKNIGEGFKETQGIRVEIVKKGQAQKIIITFEINNQKETLEIEEDLLKDIIEERRLFEEKVRGGENKI